MRQMLVTFLLGVLTGAVGLWVLGETTGGGGTPAVGVSREDLDDAIARALRGVRQEVADLRERVEGRSDDAPGTARAQQAPAPSGPSDPVEEPAAHRPRRAQRPVVTASAARDPLPVPNLDRLRELQTGEDDRELRRRWLLQSEAEALSAYGAPDRIEAGDHGQQRWIYDLPVGDEDGDGVVDTDDVTLTFHEGRLIAAED